MVPTGQRQQAANNREPQRAKARAHRSPVEPCALASRARMAAGARSEPSARSALVGFVEHPVRIARATLREKVQTSRLSIASSSDPATTVPSLSRVTEAISATNSTAMRAMRPSSEAEWMRVSSIRISLFSSAWPAVFARVDCADETFVDIIVAQFAQRFAVAIPERFEHHFVGAFARRRETGQVEVAIRRSDLADSAFDRRHDAFEFDRAGGTVGAALPDEPAEACRRVEALGYQFLLVLSPATEHRIEPQAQERRRPWRG